MQEKKHNGFTKSELSLKPGIKNLARAVIKQWQLDGYPASDVEVIEVWKKISEIDDGSAKQSLHGSYSIEGKHNG